MVSKIYHHRPSKSVRIRRFNNLQIQHKIRLAIDDSVEKQIPRLVHHQKFVNNPKIAS